MCDLVAGFVALGRNLRAVFYALDAGASGLFSAVSDDCGVLLAIALVLDLQTMEGDSEADRHGNPYPSTHS